MRTVLALLFLPCLALAAGPAARKKAPPKPVPTATPEPEPERAAPELSEEAAARRDQFLADGKREAEGPDWLKARASYRKAVEIDPSHAEAKAGLAEVETECLRNAKRQISEAKAYQNAFNYGEAERALALALRYADLPRYKEHAQIRSMQNALKRENER